MWGGYLFSELVTNLIQVLTGQEGLFAPVSHPSLVCLVIMQGKYRVDVLPFAMLWSNVRTTFLDWRSQHVVDSPQMLRVGLWPWGSFAIGLSVSKPVKPVANTAQVRQQISSISFLCSAYREV
jgi:hypothetical protein